MKRGSTIVRSCLALFMALISLAVSGSYVAYYLRCEGMQQRQLTINGMHTCCCDDPASPSTSGEVTLSSERCCHLEVQPLGVDAFSVTLFKAMGSPCWEQPVTLPLAIGQAALPPHPACGLSPSHRAVPPDRALPLGSEIIFQITRQLRI